jgi:hypothetical protein
LRARQGETGGALSPDGSRLSLAAGDPGSVNHGGLRDHRHHLRLHPASRAPERVQLSIRRNRRAHPPPRDPGRDAGGSLHYLGQVEEAAVYFRRALAVYPEIPQREEIEDFIREAGEVIPEVTTG